MGHVTVDSSDLELTDDTQWHGGYQLVGIRFEEIQIPKGATIESAVLELVADSSNSEASMLTISGQDIDDAPTFTVSDFDLSSREKTASQVIWSDIPSWTIGNSYRSCDISTVIQEIVDRPGWTPGNALAVFIGDIGIREAVSYDQTPADAPKILVDY